MMQLKRNLKLLLILMMSVLAACSTVFDDRDSCPVGCHIRFKYDYNMKWADAFANEVDQVSLYVFDNDGKYVKTIIAKGDSLKDKDYFMNLDVKPGNYKLVAFGGLTGESFKAPALQAGTSTLQDLQVSMVENSPSSQRVSNTELHPLWQGMESSINVTGGYQEDTISLVKDTNKLKVVLQQIDGDDLTNDIFDMRINDNNTHFGYDNSIIAENTDMTYIPYFNGVQKVDDTTVGVGNIVYSQFSLSRLMVDSKSRLRIDNKISGSHMIDIPLVNYLLLTEMEGHKISAQEYLDRQDEYSFVFFIDKNYRWVQVQIIVNGWTIRLNNPDL